MEQLILDKDRKKAKLCPCGKKNNDGKFAPFKGFVNKGYCHSCGETFLPDRNIPDAKCYYVEFESIMDHSEKSKMIVQNKSKYYLPKSVIFEIVESGCFVSEWFLEKEPNGKPDYKVMNYKFYAKDHTTIFEALPAQKEQKITLIPSEYYLRSFISESNNFIQYLQKLFGIEITNNLRNKYLIGTSNKWLGATVFWQRDIEGNIRTGKIMQYNPNNGKRIKEPYELIYWEHKALNQPDFNLKQCLFGEHLINQNLIKPIAIVESEKTAIIASIYLPNLIWLSVGSISYLKAEICKPLKGRTVILFPDLNGFEKWKLKASELLHIANFSVSDLLDKKANEFEKEQGLDIADYLIRFDFRDFLRSETGRKQSTENEQKTTRNADKTPVNLESDIKTLKAFFNTIQKPKNTIKLNDYLIINDVSKFVVSHLQTLKSNRMNKTFEPYLSRLKELQEYLILNTK